MILNCAIIDDEPLAAELLASYARRVPELNLIGSYNSAIDAMGVIRNNPVDFIFLDIQMPELSGLELARMLPKRTKIIFTTAFDNYAIDGYKVNAFDYLLKPISFEFFVKSVNKVIEYMTELYKTNLSENNNYIYIKSEYRLVKIVIDNILYVEGLKDYIKIYLSDGQKPILSLMSMKTIENALPDDKFMRVHRSYIVNKSCIDIIERGRIIIGKTVIPVSESYKDIFQKYMDNHTIQ